MLVLLFCWTARRRNNAAVPPPPPPPGALNPVELQERLRHLRVSFDYPPFLHSLSSFLPIMTFIAVICPKSSKIIVLAYIILPKVLINSTLKYV